MTKALVMLLFIFLVFLIFCVVVVRRRLRCHGSFLQRVLVGRGDRSVVESLRQLQIIWLLIGSLVTGLVVSHLGFSLAAARAGLVVSHLGLVCVIAPLVAACRSPVDLDDIEVLGGAPAVVAHAGHLLCGHELLHLCLEVVTVHHLEDLVQVEPGLLLELRAVHNRAPVLADVEVLVVGVFQQIRAVRAQLRALLDLLHRIRLDGVEELQIVRLSLLLAPLLLSVLLARPRLVRKLAHPLSKGLRGRGSSSHW